ncbi:MAG: helix-hairpin-helix domain-containing protein, partial [Clostridia bacterium]|nr:helix-hairpin-helix domain-containing protein [Clostridia bacterium]
GPRRRRALLMAYPSLDALRAASVEELSHKPSMNTKAAQAVYEFFHGTSHPQ